MGEHDQTDPMLLEGRGVRKRLLRRAAGAGTPSRLQPGGSAHRLARRRASAATDPRDHARRGRVPRPHGIRAISRRHLTQPSVFDLGGQEHNVHYLPAESGTGMFAGNSNWRGPRVVSDESDHPALTISAAPMKAAGGPGGAWWSSRVETASLSLLIARRDRGRGSRERREARERVGRAMRPTRCAGINRHEKGDGSSLRRRSSYPRWP